ELLLAMFERAEKWSIHSGPGHWPDADMLPVGSLRQDYDKADVTKFTRDEQITMMSLWCMMRSPLIIGAHLPKNDDFTLQLLTNKDVLAIEKESHCAHQLYRTEEEIAWLAPRKDGTGVYVALFNISDQEKEMSFTPEEADLQGYTRVKELWSGKEQENEALLTATVSAHGAVIYRFA
ncbi:MAG: alpha-galactosidase, partial [Lachnospiraceae bacterium]|nr:alpha-galactosidase [Lachnospiraceae bacterium]